MLGNSLFGAVKITKNVDFDQYKYYGYGVGFDINGIFSLSNGTELGKNFIIFGVDMNSLVHIDNEKKYILILGKRLTQGLDDTALTAEKEYAIHFSEQQENLCASWFLLLLLFLFVLFFALFKFYLVVLKSINSKQKIVNKCSSIMLG